MSDFVKLLQQMERSELVELIKTVLTVGEKKSFLGSLTLEILYEIMSKVCVVMLSYVCFIC